MEPLFKTESSIYRRMPRALSEDDDDEDWVDRSIPSTPLDEDPPMAGPGPSSGHAFTRARSSTPVSMHVKREPSPEMTVKDEPLHGDDRQERDEDTPLREIDSDDLEELDEHEPEDERQCRICFAGKEEESALGRLISPCLCTGSVRVSTSCQSTCCRVPRADTFSTSMVGVELANGNLTSFVGLNT